MLDHVGRQDLATRVRAAIERVVVTNGIRTRDLGGKATTSDLTAALRQAVAT